MSRKKSLPREPTEEMQESGANALLGIIGGSGWQFGDCTTGKELFVLAYKAAWDAATMIAVLALTRSDSYWLLVDMIARYYGWMIPA